MRAFFKFQPWAPIWQLHRNRAGRGHYGRSRFYAHPCHGNADEITLGGDDRVRSDGSNDFPCNVTVTIDLPTHRAAVLTGLNKKSRRFWIGRYTTIDAALVTGVPQLNHRRDDVSGSRNRPGLYVRRHRELPFVRRDGLIASRRRIG